MKFLALKNHSVPYCYFSSLSDAQMDLRHPLRLSVKHRITYSHSLIDRLVPPPPTEVSLNLFDLVQIYTLVSTT